MPIFAVIAMPEGFVGDITDNASGFVADLSPVTTLIIGVLLASTVLVVIIKAIRS